MLLRRKSAALCCEFIASETGTIGSLHPTTIVSRFESPGVECTCSTTAMPGQAGGAVADLLGLGLVTAATIQSTLLISLVQERQQEKKKQQHQHIDKSKNCEQKRQPTGTRFRGTHSLVLIRRYNASSSNIQLRKCWPLKERFTMLARHQKKNGHRSNRIYSVGSATAAAVVELR